MLLLAHLRGHMAIAQKRGMRAALRKEIILITIAAELDADEARDKLLSQSILLGADIAANQLTRAVKDAASNIARVWLHRELGTVDTAQGGVTVDGMFKIYQALMRAKVIKTWTKTSQS